MLTTANGIDLGINQFVDAWRLMCSGASGYTGGEADGVQFIFSGVPIPFFNVAVVTDRQVSADALKQAAGRTTIWSAGKKVPWLLVVTHETLESGVDAAAVVDGCGFAPLMPLTGMIAEGVAPPTNVPAELELIRPRDDEGCGAILDVNGLAYGMDLAAGKSLMGTAAFWAGHFPVVGLVAGKPAVAAVVMMVEGYRYVALVATDPGHQRRGYGEAAMRRALELSAVAYPDRPTVLHATEAGRPIYERMGYTPISTHTIFMAKEFLAGH